MADWIFSSRCNASGNFTCICFNSSFPNNVVRWVQIYLEYIVAQEYSLRKLPSSLLHATWRPPTLVGEVEADEPCLLTGFLRTTPAGAWCQMLGDTLMILVRHGFSRGVTTLWAASRSRGAGLRLIQCTGCGSPRTPLRWIRRRSRSP